jgi:hypothetical protein
MRKPHERLRFIRQLQNLPTAKAAADAYGWKYDACKSAENGMRELTAEMAEIYAAGYKVRAGWLLFGEGEWDTSPASYGKITLAH